MRFLTTLKIGPKRSMTPEGFLLCEDVPVARIGEQVYTAEELPELEAGPDGLIYVTRSPEEVFADATMASCQGKDITLDHPDKFVAPANYRELTCGVMLSPRRGTGELDDMLLADLLIKEPTAIDAVLHAGVEQVSLGYDAEYKQESPGRGAQRNIVVNHAAIVLRARCGGRCTIGDKEPDMKFKDSKPVKRTWIDRLKTAMRAKDSEAVEEALEEGQRVTDAEGDPDPDDKPEKEDKGDTKTNDTLKLILRRLNSMDADIQEMKKETEDDDPDDDPDASTTDAGGDLTTPETAGKLDDGGVKLYTGDSARQILARAEILSPGIKIPTIDSKMRARDSATALCSCQRRALTDAYRTDAGRDAITPFLDGREADFDKMAPQILNAVFTGAAELMRSRNNLRTHDGLSMPSKPGRLSSPADINKANTEFWAKRNAQ